MAYNEEANIGSLMSSVMTQKLTSGQFDEIFVVSSGSTDRTEDIVQEFAAKDSRIRLLTQAHREGKASAINLFLTHATGDVLILESGDTIPEKDTFERLVAPFDDDSVGMTGAHPVPVNRNDTFIGFCVHLMWSLHHRIALVTPKLGELVAFRNIVKEIPADTAVDEASIEAIVRKAGYRLAYVPDAVVRNKGPENVRDFLKQRRRIAAGHKHLMREEAYEVSTMDAGRILRLLLRGHRWRLRPTLWTAGAIGLEFLGRALGYYDFRIRGRNPFVWDIAASTKRLDRLDR
jgi:cellulose synthase/poly-beta-1,6-N-acetylglucosamine synthase-like glycosyltransferase